MGHRSDEDRRSYDREYYRRRRANQKWIVYKLKGYDYVGITKDPKKRMPEHAKHGRPTEYRVIMKFNRPEPAIMLEALLHWFGYKGCQYGKKDLGDG